jgi:ABC-type transporter Mla MlaB component
MTTFVDWHKVDGEHVTQDLVQVREKLSSAEGEVLLDFSEVGRIDPHGLFAVEDFANAADEKAVKVSLRGVNVVVYKVLKLARLTPRFSFVN